MTQRDMRARSPHRDIIMKRSGAALFHFQDPTAREEVKKISRVLLLSRGVINVLMLIELGVSEWLALSASSSHKRISENGP